MGLFSFLGSGGGKIKDALRKGAIIIDVRTPQEFDGGKVPESINIPVDRIAANAERIKNMKRPIIFCCASGSRSSNAASIMKQNGLKEVYNGGSWENVLKILKSL
ncbi:MAG: rhodanese-like domain-containing protein [Chitinophagaceae bacterium]|nr:rhodanese-like domain-containing protein [Chitinophagaceae bacterium]